LQVEKLRLVLHQAKLPALALKGLQLAPQHI
jgi:hypothetical protein